MSIWYSGGSGSGTGPAGPPTPVLFVEPAALTILAANDGTVTGGQLPAAVSSKVREANLVATGWTFAKVDSSNVTSTINSSTGDVSVTALTGDSETVEITATKTGYDALSYTLTVKKVRAGAAGGGGGAPTTITAADLATAISGSTLTANAFYRVTDTTPNRLYVATATNAVLPVVVGGETSSVLTSFQTGATALQTEYVTGLPLEPTIVAIKRQTITVDQGSDASHVEILFTFNCGVADTPDIAIASARFAAPDTNATVIKTAVTGATTDGQTLTYAFASTLKLRNIFLTLRGGTSYTTAAATTATTSTAVLGTWAEALNAKFVELKIGTAYGTNNRYRDIIVTGFGSV